MGVIHNGDALEVLKTLPSGSAQMCVTSPPYWGLRDYGVAGQLGLEKSPQEYVDKLVGIFREVRRILKGDGTLWLNLGDSYAAAGKHRTKEQAVRKTTLRGGLATQLGIVKQIPKTGAGLKPKDLVGIPWMVAFALRADGWYLRSEIIWHKKNCTPESVTDRPTKSHEKIFLFAKNSSYYYCADSIREPHSEVSVKRSSRALNYKHQPPGQPGHTLKSILHPKGRNKRDVWSVSTKPFKGAHFATFPTDLIEPCILAGSRPGDTILDPFFGAGTTGLVAMNHARNWIGVELNSEYCEMARERIGLDANPAVGHA